MSPCERGCDCRLVERLRQRMRQAVAHPADRAALVRRLSKRARAGPELVDQACVVCGTLFQTRTALVRAGQGKTCSLAYSRQKPTAPVPTGS